MALPKYTEKHGWRGGDRRTLYAYVADHDGSIVVRPGDGARGIGPTCTVRVATRSEALEHWQNPLHVGWTVAADAGERRADGRCSHCGASGFTYTAFSVPRGYTCMTCGTIKPERALVADEVRP